MQSNVYGEFAAIEQTHWWFVARRKILNVFLQRYGYGKKDIKVRTALDIGSGPGINAELIEKVAEKVICIEPSNEGYEFAKKKSSPIRQVIHGEFPSAVPAGQKFDVITLFDVLEHIEDEGRTVRKLKEILNAGGRLFITVPAYEWMWTNHDDVVHHQRRYTTNGLRKVLEANGFELVRLSYFNTFLFPGIAGVRAIKKMLGTDNGSTDFSITPGWSNRIFTAIFGLESYILKYISLPFGVSVMAVAKHKQSNK